MGNCVGSDRNKTIFCCDMTKRDNCKKYNYGDQINNLTSKLTNFPQNNVHIYMQLGDIYEKINQHADAIVYYAYAYNISKDYDCAYNLCRIYMQLEQYKSSIDILDTINVDILTDHQRINYYKMLSSVEFKTGTVAHAQEILQHAFDIAFVMLDATILTDLTNQYNLYSKYRSPDPLLVNDIHDEKITENNKSQMILNDKSISLNCVQTSHVDRTTQTTHEILNTEYVKHECDDDWHHVDEIDEIDTIDGVVCN